MPKDRSWDELNNFNWQKQQESQPLGIPAALRELKAIMDAIPRKDSDEQPLSDKRGKLIDSPTFQRQVGVGLFRVHSAQHLATFSKPPTTTSSIALNLCTALAGTIFCGSLRSEPFDDDWFVS